MPPTWRAPQRQGESGRYNRCRWQRRVAAAGRHQLNVETVDYRAGDAADTLARSLSATGFAVLVNHPIAPDRVKSVYEKWAAFFDGESKHDYTVQPPSHAGYFPYRSENAKDSDVKDLKEFFHVYPDSRLPGDIAETTRGVYAELENLGRELLGWIQDRMPPEVASRLSMPLDRMMAQSKQSLLRILHYPPVDKAEVGAIRAAAHEDINLITLLLAGSEPGLEARDADGNWHSIACDPGMITINNGDMLSLATGGHFPSTTHRVTNPARAKNVSRYSMPMFLHPHGDVMLDAGTSADDYLQQRLREIGLK